MHTHNPFLDLVLTLRLTFVMMLPIPLFTKQGEIMKVANMNGSNYLSPHNMTPMATNMAMCMMPCCACIERECSCASSV